MPPRLHNIVSYSVAALVFAGVAGLCSGRASGATQFAFLGAAMWCVHFARRTFESAFVHRYARPAIPIADVAIEYVYYWGFAVWNALSLFSSDYQPRWSLLVWPGVLVFALAELGNAMCHVMLRELRASDSQARAMPRGFLFEWVSCPHYLFEILSWLGFAMAVQTWAALCFALLGAGILAFWARTRHAAYKKDFDGVTRELYPAARRALVPFVF
ncbi:MAG TPA: hypothetical protein VGI10_06670 [Polyangiaceae bacterium]|jgi:very-long-chain enoyl-CoA reductase